MKKLLYIPLLMFMCACGSSLTYTDAIEENNERYENKEARQDALNLVEAKSYSLLLEKLGEVGAQRGYAVVVQNFGNKIKQDHTLLSDQMNELGKNEDIKLPSKMSEKHQMLYDELNTTTRQEFDRQFIRVVERVYEDSIELYKSIATNASDDEVRAFAAKKLSLLRTNEERADELEDELI